MEVYQAINIINTPQLLVCLVVEHSTDSINSVTHWQKAKSGGG